MRGWEQHAMLLTFSFYDNYLVYIYRLMCEQGIMSMPTLSRSTVSTVAMLLKPDKDCCTSVSALLKSSISKSWCTTPVDRIELNPRMSSFFKLEDAQLTVLFGQNVQVLS